MAREEHDREDLLREATALVERIEWQIEGFPETIVAGFRGNGALSLFFSADPVYQFNAQFELRRAYLEGNLVKAEQGRLASLNRVRTENRVELRRNDLSEAETAGAMANLEEHLDRLLESLRSEAYTTIGQVPPTADITTRVIEWLANRPRPVQIAQRPNV